MAVKIGDIVSYEGNNYRVTKRFSQTVYISGENGNRGVPVSDVTIIKSTILPNIKLGDDVIIHDIPRHERDEDMDGVWVFGCVKWMNLLVVYIQSRKHGITMNMDHL